ncbi:Bug family tripartite tricarboxylate transporter substrate binding protein [Zwartia panacis]|uniref:Bug family tripartite tricarboxylate transporter substrate binding protein n=1 Tax=Zwartia panacis TaxID=2683345 RepID=UPI0025B2E0D1|nr:tripartite tricarboxylate transporter substrate binding protein [Zwartia panacis]MDN4017911.1 tripartite tricarboxylate transporter substrate binding protein [Zwartia panacis]
MKKIMLCAVSIATLLSSSLVGAQTTAQSAAQAFPNKPIRFVVPFPPGGGNDILARALAPKMSEILGQQVVIDNRAGAGGNIGADFVAKSPPDGYTIVIASNQVTMNPWIYSKLPFDIAKDFAPVAQVASVPMLLAIHPEVPATNLKEFIALAKAKPGSLNYSTPGLGTPQHIAFEVFNFDAGVKVTHVPYKGTSPSIVDLIGGQVQATLGTMASLDQHVKSGKVRPIAVSTPQRSPAMPDIPTIEEGGLKGYNVPLWYSVLAPANTPKDIVAKISASIRDALKDPQTKAQLERQGFVESYLDPEQMSALITKDLAYWQKAIQNIGLKLD